MYEQHKIEKQLKAEATRISKKLGGAPVVIAVGGSIETDIPRTTTASSSMGEDILELWSIVVYGEFRRRSVFLPYH